LTFASVDSEHHVGTNNGASCTTSAAIVVGHSYGAVALGVEFALRKIEHLWWADVDAKTAGLTAIFVDQDHTFGHLDASACENTRFKAKYLSENKD
jgi:hypothetical protein